jgi:hypothetical protein
MGVLLATAGYLMVEDAVREEPARTTLYKVT